MNTYSKILAALATVTVLGGTPLVPASSAAAVDHTTSRAAQAACARTLASYPVLRPGARRPAVRTLQCALDDLGAHLVVDGYYGPRTRAAVQHIEDGFEGVPAHPGRIDAGFWTLLYARQLPSRVLGQGDHGHSVRVLQRALRAAGGDLAVDGRFGPETRRVMRAYQRHVGVRTTGTYNADTAFWLSMGGTF